MHRRRRHFFDPHSQQPHYCPEARSLHLSDSVATYRPPGGGVGRTQPTQYCIAKAKRCCTTRFNMMPCRIIMAVRFKPEFLPKKLPLQARLVSSFKETLAFMHRIHHSNYPFLAYIQTDQGSGAGRVQHWHAQHWHAHFHVARQDRPAGLSARSKRMGTMENTQLNSTKLSPGQLHWSQLIVSRLFLLSAL